MWPSRLLGRRNTMLPALAHLRLVISKFVATKTERISWTQVASIQQQDSDDWREMSLILVNRFQFLVFPESFVWNFHMTIWKVCKFDITSVHVDDEKYNCLQSHVLRGLNLTIHTTDVIRRRWVKINMQRTVSEKLLAADQIV